MSSLIDLPDAIVMQILSTVPAKTIFTCRCVCKNWLNLVSSPFFAKLHAIKSHPSTVMLLNSGKLSLCDLEDIYQGRLSQCHRLFSRTDFVTSSAVLGSCNGLLLLRHKVTGTCYIYNPNLNEHVVLNTCDEEGEKDGGIFGMGYSSVGNKYKVVKFVDNTCSGKLEAKVFTLGLGQTTTSFWRNTTGKVPFPSTTSFWLPRGVFHHGSIYWFLVRFFGPNPFGIGAMCCFDIDSEQFQIIATPPPLRFLDIYFYQTPQPWWNSIRLGVLGDRLHITYNVPGGPCNMLVMTTDHGGCCQYWDQGYVFENNYKFFHILKELSNGEILVMSEGDLFLYSHTTMKLSLLKDGSWITKEDDEENGQTSILRVPRWLRKMSSYLQIAAIPESIAYIPSLVSPKQLMTNVVADH